MSKENSADNTLKQLLGIMPGTKNDTAFDVIGAALFTGGFLQSITSKYPKYGVPETKQVGQIGAMFPGKITGIESQYVSDLAKQADISSKSAEQSMIARGIVDKDVLAGAKGQYEAGLSGAYATAKTALAKAKLGAQTTLNNALTSYYSSIVDKQFKSQLDQMASRVGIWGTLGGMAGSAAMSLKNPAKVKSRPSASNVGQTSSQDTDFILPSVGDREVL